MTKTNRKIRHSQFIQYSLSRSESFKKLLIEEFDHGSD
ncbi:hypothetical protein [Vibrio cholerae]|nr:hypothetical protein [Vibrio cholerae]CPR23497.1 hypothetical protein [Vibrio cholerae]CPR23516.1 hypothetical protein [Vibrio cholerae]